VPHAKPSRLRPGNGYDVYAQLANAAWNEIVRMCGTNPVPVEARELTERTSSRTRSAPTLSSTIHCLHNLSGLRLAVIFRAGWLFWRFSICFHGDERVDALWIPHGRRFASAITRNETQGLPGFSLCWKLAFGSAWHRRMLA